MKKLSLLASFGIVATLAAQIASAGDACSGLSGTYTLTTKGAHFIARLETYTTRITITPESRLAVDSNWGLDWHITLNRETHTVAETGNDQQIGMNVAGDPEAYLENLNHVNFNLTALQMNEIRPGKTDAKAADALECAIEKVAAELAFARTQQIAYIQARKAQFEKVSSDVNLNKTVTVNVAQTPAQAQQQPSGASQSKAQ